MMQTYEECEDCFLAYLRSHMLAPVCPGVFAASFER
jgi:hypothetical protein